MCIRDRDNSFIKDRQYNSVGLVYMTLFLEDLKNQIVEALQGNLVCIFLTGSRVRGEERKGSDYDLAIIVSRINEEVLCKLRRIFLNLTGFSVYLLDRNDLKTLPTAMFLQFVYSKKLYGDLDYPLPSKEDVANYVNILRRDWLDRIRHYLILPHSHEKLASVLLPALKSVYLCLSYLIFKETSKLPLTRKYVMDFLKKQENCPSIRLMKILEEWDSCKETYLKNPLPLLLQIEKFYRTLSI